MSLHIFLAAAVLAGSVASADDGQVRRELQRVYDRASAAAVAARTLADLDAIHEWLDTPDCVFADAGQPRRTWTEMRRYAADGLQTRLTSMTNEMLSLDVGGSTATATTRVRGVASIVDAQGEFGPKGATHDIETTATVRDVWVKTTTGWRRRSHDKIVANQVTAIDGKRRAPPGSPSASVEQTSAGTGAAPELVVQFDGLGAGFSGPQGTAAFRNPSDNSLAVGPHHVVQTVNTRIAVFDKGGKVLYGPAPTNTVFKGFGGQCEARNNGDAVVRYDQLANRWLIVMPVFAREPARSDQPPAWKAGETYVSPPGRPNQPGPPVPLARQIQEPAPRAAGPAAGLDGPYSMCYAVSAGPDPLGAYYRYEFLRSLFPDYPRPAIWPDGYYVATSTGDDRISATVATQKHACVVDRAKLLKGEAATEQCIVIENVNFLNNADLDGTALPPSGSPNVMMAAGGMQLDRVLEADTIDVWQFHVDWREPRRTAITGPQKIKVAPYHYLCDGQLSNCVPQPGSDRRLDAQGDKIMARLVYRRIRDQESIVAVHSVNTAAGAGGVRWYEFRIDPKRAVHLHQQGTYAPDSLYRWMASPAIDRAGNIGIGYSFGGGPHFTGQRFAARLAGDPPGVLTTREAILVEGEAAQNVMRWEDYTQTAIDPSDDCTIWYVGDYLGRGSDTYSTRIGAFRLPGCR